MAKNDSRSTRLSLTIISIVMTLIGLFFVFEASTAESYATYGHQYYFVQKQAIWMVAGIVAMIAAAKMPIKFWKKIASLLYLFSLFFLLAVFIPGIGLELNGARRWVNLGPVNFQPVEMAKLSLCLFFSAWMVKHQRLLPFIFLTGLPSLILLLQPDVGSLLILIAIAAGLFFVAGGDLKKVLPVAGLGILALTLAVVTSSYRMKRVKTFFDPSSDPLGASFHIKQITLALGSGGLLGQGLGNSRQKYAYIPEASSDSIFAIVAEEVGFVGSGVILLMFAIYFYLIYRLARQQKTGSFGQLCLYGLLIWLAGQTLLNLGAVVALVPMTGLPLPFFSYGGSSLVMVLLANGIILSAAKS
ncbi:MAG: putative peptidoglycan glycosyltransferase FtsW [Patescibacteria group bacterium]|nr:putative peptidoglycan glycosyltransferase FtsW [Patescibacteria group bacterium]